MSWLKDVYFLNAHELAQKLRDGKVSEFQALKHLIIATILVGANFSLPVSFDINPDPSEAYIMLEWWFFFVLAGVISYYGILLCYQANAKGDGNDFFVRYSALGLPVMIRLLFYSLVMALPFLFAAIFFATLLDEIGFEVFFGIEYVYYTVIAVVYFIMMRKYIAIAAGYEH